jgi:hypothetical protein
MNDRHYTSIEPDPNGSDTVTSREGGIEMPVRVSHYVRERGAGSPVGTAGGQRDALRVAGPYATRGEAETEAARRNAW